MTTPISHEWRAVVGWEGFYEVSSAGEVRSVPRISTQHNGRTYSVVGGVLTPLLNTNGYYRTCLADKAASRTEFAYIHRLVATAFIPNPHNLPQVNHIDGNELNNAVTNLEWVTARENLAHAWKIGRIDPSRTPKLKGSKNGASRLTEATVAEARRLKAEGYGTVELARRFGVSHQTMSSALLGQTWKHVK